MRASFWKTTGYVIAGAVIGTLAGQLIVHQVPALGKETMVQWNPSGDLAVIHYSINVTLRVNWLTLIGALVGFAAARRWK
jgi:hypothetical protein